MEIVKHCHSQQARSRPLARRSQAGDSLYITEIFGGAEAIEYYYANLREGFRRATPEELAPYVIRSADAVYVVYDPARREG